MPVAQATGREVGTVEGLSDPDGAPSRLQLAFLAAGAAQCGVCTPGMLMAADDLLATRPVPSEAEVEDALGGVLCRCTGYRKIIEAVLAATADSPPAGPATPPAGHAVGARVPKVDGLARVLGTASFGADERPEGFLALRAVRSPHARARFRVGDLAPLHARFPGLVRVLAAADVPGQNRYGVYATGKDQPVLAEDDVRHRGEAVLALVGEEATIEAIDDRDVPITWEPLPPLDGIDAALEAGAPQLHDASAGNVLVTGRVAHGDIEDALGRSFVTTSVEVETPLLEHAYIEPEAGFARRVGDRIESHGQHPDPVHGSRRGCAGPGAAPGSRPDHPHRLRGRIRRQARPRSSSALIATAAWLLERPVRAVWTRPESMAASPKRHPSRIRATAGANADGRLTGFRFHGDFDTGAYASWGPTVAHRVPVHASGPYAYGAVLATSRAVYTNGPPAGAFRGFGVPAGGDRPRGADGRACRRPGNGPARVPTAERAAGRFDRPPPARFSTRAPVSRRASRRCGRTGTGCGPRRQPATRARQTGRCAEWASARCGTASATPR